MKNRLFKILTSFFCFTNILLFSQSWEKLEQDYISQLNKKEFKSAKITANKMKHVSLKEYGDTSSYYMKSLYHLSFFDLHDNNDTSAIKILEEAKRYFNTETKKGLYLYHRILLDLSYSYYFIENYNKVYECTNELLLRENDYKYLDDWELGLIFRNRAEASLKISYNVKTGIEDIRFLIDKWINELDTYYSNHEDDKTAGKILGELNSSINILYNYYLLESNYNMALKVFELYNGLKKFELPDSIKYNILDNSLANKIMLGLDVDLIKTTNDKIELLNKGNILPINSSDFYFALGQNYLHLKDYKNALEFTIKSIELSKSTDLHPLYNKNGQLGDIFSRTEMYEWAIQAYDKKKTLMKEGKQYTEMDDITYNLNIANLYISLNKYSDANTYLDKLLNTQIISRTDLDLTYSLKSTVLLAQNKPIEATEFESKSFNLLKEEILELLPVLSNSERASLVTSKGAQLNSIIATSLLTSKYSPNNLAFNVILFQKNLLLESERAIYSIVSSDSLLKKQFEQFFDLKRKLSYLSGSLYNKSDKSEHEKLLEDIVSLENKLMRKFPEGKLNSRNENYTHKNIKKHLSSNECAIEFISYIEGNKKYYSALLAFSTNENPISIHLTNRNILDSINNLIEENYSSDNLSGRTYELNTHLYHMFWEPLESYLKGIKTIYYSPIDELNNMSFSTFVVNSIDTTYLMDKYNLESVLSTSSIITNKNPVINNLVPSIALFGGIEYNFVKKPNSDLALVDNRALNKSIRGSYSDKNKRNEVSSLPFTKTEVDDISNLLSKNKWIVTKEFGIEATENKMKKLETEKSPTILHFATHGFAFPEADNNQESAINIFESSDNPMQRSGLLFYAANDTWNGKRDTVMKYTGEDGILTAEEVSNLDLTNTKLVVISACQSGLGAIKGTEGVYGLKRAFRLAGVENMIVSLWPVPDKETMELMNLFYEELIKTKDINLSFQNAQKTMRYKYPNDPWAWGGFVLVR